ncbi:hypothetical protein [Butyricimonas paravirosa]
MRKITILIALFISTLFGCQNSDLELAPTEKLQSNEQLSLFRETFDFTYKGQTYSSLFHMENDTLMILEDENVAAIYEKIQELPELAIHVTQEGVISYYDNYDELQQNNPVKNIEDNGIMPFDYADAADLVVYKDFNYNNRTDGNRHAFFLRNPLSVPDLNPYGMDDMISSFELLGSSHSLSHTCRVTFFRSKNSKSQSLSFDYKEGTYDSMWQYYYYLRVPTLKSYKVKRGKTWNDRISSFKFFILN